LLTGARPFQSDSLTELLDEIKTREPKPPRQVDDGIPPELDRICLRALSKRASDRYSTAIDLANDLRHWLSQAPDTTPAPSMVAVAPARAGEISVSELSLTSRIVPKGLRSFDASDADFFLSLLPGPFDREGIPESVRFWKTRIEETDPDGTFTVGLIYGPSGCGKSSLVKAGLLPLLSDQVISVYLEATGDQTESRVLKRLQRRFSGLPADASLAQTLSALRQNPDITAGKKLLIVIDQFEQWLHARPEEQWAELVDALRQCDGEHVQCLLMIRDDFWMGATRILRELEVRLVDVMPTYRLHVRSCCGRL
jgi:hypothetical protein